MAARRLLCYQGMDNSTRIALLSLSTVPSIQHRISIRMNTMLQASANRSLHAMAFDLQPGALG